MHSHIHICVTHSYTSTNAIFVQKHMHKHTNVFVLLLILSKRFVLNKHTHTQRLTREHGCRSADLSGIVRTKVYHPGNFGCGVAYFFFVCYVTINCVTSVEIELYNCEKE